MRWLELGILAEFVDRLGVVRRTAGCSIVGRFEFADRLEQLQALMEGLPSERSWVAEYAAAGQFTHLVDRLLALNGLEPDWLTSDMVSALIFGRVEDGELQPGWLVTLNNPPRERKPEGKAATLAEIIAGLSENLTEAFDLAAEVPAHLTIDVIDARNEMLKSPEEKAEVVKREQMANLRRDYASLMG